MGNRYRRSWILGLIVAIAALGAWLLAELLSDPEATPEERGNRLEGSQEAGLLRGTARDSAFRTAAPSDTVVAVESANEEAIAVPDGSSPPRTLEVRLAVGHDPLSRGVVLLWRHDPKRPMPHHRIPDRQQELDGNGFARFVDLEQDAWTPGLRIEGCVHSFGPQVVLDHSPNKRVSVALGTGAIAGTVYANNGDPAENAVLSTATRKGKYWHHVTARSDMMGRYQMRYLGDWPRTIYIQRPGHDSEGRVWPSDQKDAWARPHKQSEVNWGSTQGRPLLAGQVVCQDGLPVQGPGSIFLKVDGVLMLTLPYKIDGTFRRHVDPNAYKVEVAVPNPPRRRIKFDYEHGTDRSDLRWTIPGTRVVGQAEFADGKSLPSRCRVVLALDDPDKWRSHKSRMHGDRFRFDGIPPGRYRLQFHLRQGKPVDGPTLVVSPLVPEVRRDVVLPSQ